MKVGDHVSHLAPTISDVQNKNTSPATVIYIHPDRRFYTVEFSFPQGRTCRESYYFYPRSAATRRREGK